MVGFQPLNITSDDLNCLSHSPSPRDKVSLTLEELPYLQRERRGGGGGGRENEGEIRDEFKRSDS